jgi:hypothetical protein
VIIVSYLRIPNYITERTNVITTTNADARSNVGGFMNLVTLPIEKVIVVLNQVVVLPMPFAC